MSYIGTSPSNGVRKVHTYTATAGQTTFSGVGSENITLSYSDGTYVDVYQNGVLLGTADYTATSGTSIVLAQGASVNDIIVVTVYDIFSVADTVSKSDGGTFDGALTVSGAFTSQGIDDNADATAITIDSSENVGIGNTNPNGGKLHVTNSTGAIGYFQSTQSASNVENIILNSTQTNSSANLSLQINDGTTAKGQMRLNGDNSIAIHNTTSLTERVRIASDGKVGIGITSPAEALDVAGKVQATGDFDGVGLDLDASGINFNVNQSANNLTATFIGAGLGTMELQGTSSGAFIDMKQGDNDYDARFGANNSGGYIANNSASFSISGTGSFTATIVGALSKSSGSFKINHPLESKKNTHHLFHSFVEGPQCDNLYRGKVDLVNGTASINIDTKAGMTEGTFVALNRDIQCFTTNETGWTAIKGSVSGNVLTITAQDNTCTDTISWLVIGERQDDEIKASSLTDDDGNLIVEKLKSESPDANQNYGNV
jgi:hypothetical protein